jgi:hypothetical protein
VRIIKNIWFERFARKERITDAVLHKAIQAAEQGLIDADLGGGVIKQRIARPGQGKSGGYRSIILFKSGDRALFVYGFAKSDQDNITAREIQAFRTLATHFLAMSDAQLMQAIENNDWQEVRIDDENLSE